MPQNFDPLPGDPIYLFEQEYVVQPHPQAPYLPYRQKAGRARVYQLLNKEDQYFALKEFKKRYRKPALIDSYKNLHRVENFEGLRAAKRRIVLPSDPTAKRYPSLEYAMLMPWIHGKTWFDVLGQTREGESYPDLSIAIELCDRFLEIMEALEKAGMAHTDISPGNVMVGFDPIDVQLLDLEEMYMPGVDAPPEQNTGSAGYQHRSGETTWKPEGDRYAAAVLAAEMLILSNSKLARKAADEGFFRGNYAAPEGKTRFKDARPWLKKVAPEFAEVFKRSWFADSLEGCPRISELREPIKKLSNPSLAPESPKRVETPISEQPSAASKEAVETPSEASVVGSRRLKRPPKRLIGGALAVVALLTIAVGVWATGEKFTLANTLTGHTNTVLSVAFSPDGRLLASSGADRTIKLWDPQSGKELQTLKGHTLPVLSVAFSPDGKLLASGSSDNTIKIWDPQSGKELQTLSGPTGDVESVAFSPDGKLLASGNYDGVITIWDPLSGKELQTLNGHTGAVRLVTFSPDGKLLAMGSEDGTVKLWDPQSGKEFQTLSRHTHGVYSVAFSPDGRLLASSGGDATVKLWAR